MSRFAKLMTLLVAAIIFALFSGCAATPWQNPGMVWEANCVIKKGKPRLVILIESEEKARLELTVDPETCQESIT
jgi:hypothetical protein